MAQKSPSAPASLERLIEIEELKLESLHPGGLDTTRELVELCKVGKGSEVLDVASGTGESACFIAQRFSAHVIGIDLSENMIRRATENARAKGLNVEFRQGDMQDLPFGDAMFDVVISECTLCLGHKERVLAEMARVAKPGGRVGMHDLYWTPDAPSEVKNALVDLEGERPETLDGWERLFRKAGLANLIIADKSELARRWMKSSRQQLGAAGLLALGWKVLRRWGLRGLVRILRSERIFSGKHLGYCIVVGTK